MAISPSSSLATLRPDLAGSLMEFDLQANMNDMVALQIAPVLEVDRQMGNFGRIPIEELLKTRDDLRAAGAGYNRGNGTFQPDSYSCTEHGLEEAVDDREAEMYADYFDAELIAAMRARHGILQNLETRVIASALANAVAYSGGALPAVWSDPANSTPITDITNGMAQLYAQIGRTRACLAISWARYNVLRNSTQIIDRVKYSGLVNVTRDNITPQAIAQALDVEELIVGRAVYNTANEGAATKAGTATLAGLWTANKALLFVKAKSMDIREPCFMRTIHWGLDGSQIGAAVESYRDEHVRGNVVRCRMDETEKVLYPQAAVVMNI